MVDTKFFAHCLPAVSKYDIIPILIETAKAAIKEKVIRVVIATFRVRGLPATLSLPRCIM